METVTPLQSLPHRQVYVDFMPSSLPLVASHCLCTGAAVAPNSVRATAESSTLISVEWNGLTPCRLVNGLIVKYTVQYTAGSTRMVEEVTGDWTVGGETSLSGLTPFTNYSIQVAAENDQGHVGVYSGPVTVETRESSKTMWWLNFISLFLPLPHPSLSSPSPPSSSWSCLLPHISSLFLQSHHHLDQTRDG